MTDLEALRNARGNNDAPAAKARAAETPSADNGAAIAAAGAASAFLVGAAMVGGYGKGANILNGCTIAAEKARSRSSWGPTVRVNPLP
jgi:branched-chain amino acid transport system ATP-binding protein